MGAVVKMDKVQGFPAQTSPKNPLFKRRLDQYVAAGMIRDVSPLREKHRRARDAPSNIFGKYHRKYHVNAEEERK